MTKKITALLLTVAMIFSMAVSFTGCSNDEEIMSEYMDILAQEAVSEEEIEAKITDMETFIEKNLKKLSEKESDYVLYTYIELAHEKIGADADTFNTWFEANGPYISEMMREIIELEFVEVTEPSDDYLHAGGEAFWELLMIRAFAIEALISKYQMALATPEYEYLKANLTWYYEYYVNYMITGNADRPIFTYDKGKFNEYAQSAYLRGAQSNPDTATAWAINEFFDYLNSIGYELNYKDAEESKIYYDTCAYIKKEAAKRVYQQEQ